MAYLSNPATEAEYGLVIIGQNIDVDDKGIISLPQSIEPSATVEFNGVSTVSSLLFDDKQVVTTVTPSAGDGIELTNVTTTGPATEFLITNTGVLSLIAGPGITIDATTGDITISSIGADLISVTGTSTNYTATLTDEYIGVDSASAVTITLPAGIPGRVYTIKDEKGQGSGKITIQPQVGEPIDGNVNYVISAPYQSINAVFRAGKWHLI